jgi:hypothetical protein
MRIAEAKLKRIEQDASYASAKSLEHPEWYVSRFEYHHGSLVAVTTKGTKELIFEANGQILRGNVTRAIWQLSPEIVKELIRGYRIGMRNEA